MIQLEPFTKNDFAQLIAWVDTEEQLMQFAGPLLHFPLRAAQLEIYIKEKRRYAFKVVHLSTNNNIGHAEIYLSNKNVASLCRILIGDPALRGKGYGYQVLKQLLTISFTQLNVQKAMLNVFDWNTSAIRCYEKAGFSIDETNTQQREVNGKKWTAMNMTLNKSLWLNRTPV